MNIILGNMMKCILPIVFVVFFIFSLQAQNFSGIVIDNKGNPLELVNAALYSLPDTTLIMGAVTNEKGEFFLNSNRYGSEEMFIQFSFIGYKTQTAKTKEYQIIMMEDDAMMLGELIVNAGRKIFKLENGSIVANVKNTVLETLPSANEVIEQLPFLSGKKGEFTVFGKGTPAIYINNRLVRDNKELEQLSPAEIKNIRVITTPGAAYDAAIRAVIEITTEKPFGEGLSGMIYGRATQSRAFSGGEYISLNYRIGVWDIFGSAFYNHNNYKTYLDAIQRMSLSDNERKQIYKSGEQGRTNSLNSLLGLNYNPDSYLSTGIRYTNLNNSYKGYIKNDITHTVNNISENILQGSTFRSPGNTHSVNAYYNRIFTDKLSVNINSDLVAGNEEDNMDVFYQQTPDSILQTVGVRDYNLYAVKGVLSYSSVKGILNAGIEYAHTRVSQTYSINERELGIGDTNDEAVQYRTALFTSYQTQIGKIGINTGVRYENIVMDYFQDEVKSDEQSKKYNKFFPNVSLSYANEYLQTVIGYERKINYPSYKQLRSNIQYSSPFVYESGNPMLQPHIENSFFFMFSWKDLKGIMRYSLNENAIYTMPGQFNDEPVVLLRDENIKHGRSVNIGLSYSPVFGIWRPQFEAGLVGQWLSLGEDIGTKCNTPVFNGKWFNTFSFPGKWILRIDASVMSDGHRGVAYMQSSWGIDLSITKRLLADKLSVQLSANDIFKTNMAKWDMGYGKINMLYDKDLDSRSVSLTVAYRFNSTIDKYKGQQTNDEIDRL